ncbi:MAG: cytochrome-c oxidase [Halobacteriovoraceae bacterium]|nr:cytochrome-c oxidase [Halobacteriovoraceae bacterium]
MAFYEQHIHAKPTTFLSKYVFSFDHKVIAKQFLWYGIFFLGVGGIMALMIRWALAFPGVPFPVFGQFLFPETGGVIPPDTYASLFTLHGTIMIFFAITPILIGCFGNFCIPLMIGARDMAFPAANMLSFWIAVVSGLVLLASLFTPLGGAAGGWTSYPTLSTLIGSPGVGQTLWTLSIFILGVSSTMGAINYITTVITLRAPGMGYFDMPLTVWGLWLTAILNAIFLPVLGAGCLLLLFDRVFGTHFFLAGAAATSGTGDPILFQHVFWIFGHPEVYILILPAWGIVSDLLAFFSRKPAFGAKATALSMTSITILSTLVYGHHMFTTSMSPLLTQTFMTLTMTISIPSTVFFFNWLGTIWRGSIRFDSPMLFSLGVVFVFGLGGLTGLYLGTVTTDLYLHDTYFVVGHFHYTMAASVLLGGFAGIYFWMPKMFGVMMNETLAKVHFWTTMIGLNGVFMGMLLVGYGGMHRRLYNPFWYDFLHKLIPINTFITWSAILMGFAQFFFLWNFIAALVRGKKAEDNPWEVGTLEWTIPSPAPHYNFDKIPVVKCGPHEMGNPALKDGRDFQYQTEEIVKA